MAWTREDVDAFLAADKTLIGDGHWVWAASAWAVSSASCLFVKTNSPTKTNMPIIPRTIAAGFVRLSSAKRHRPYSVPNLSVLQPERLFEPGRDLWKHFGNGEL
jgi:hypothetical protein